MRKEFLSLCRDFSGDAQSALQVESEIEVKITSIERKNRRITLSVKALELETEVEGQAIKEYAARESGATTTLGEKLKEQFSRHEDTEDEDDSD